MTIADMNLDHFCCNSLAIGNSSGSEFGLYRSACPSGRRQKAGVIDGLLRGESNDVTVIFYR
jgi:hypothetical protein